MDTKLSVAIYCRLSREDGDSIESSSIKTQKDIYTKEETKQIGKMMKEEWSIKWKQKKIS